jgi:hypothetical protein
MRHLALRLLLGLALGLSALAPAAQSQDRLPEYLLKARVLRSLLDFVTWPQPAAGEQTLVTVLGISPFETNLENAFTSPHGAFRAVNYARRLHTVGDTRILIICESEAQILPQILEQVKGKPVLTVSDTPGFAHRGVMINLMVKQKQMAMEVNLGALRSAKLQLSSHVLKMATLVEAKP